MPGVKRRNENENVFARPNGLRENTETAISYMGLGPARKKRDTSSREEEEEDTQIGPCGKSQRSRNQMVGECEMYKEERDVLEKEMTKIDECDTEKSGALPVDSSEKTIAILGGRGCPQTAKQEGDKISQTFHCDTEMSLFGVGTVFRLKKDAWSTVK